jgi:hypothetical protein
MMPMQYYLEDVDIYLFTTEDMKTHDIDANPEIFLQVEEIHDSAHWRSVIVNGRADRNTSWLSLKQIWKSQKSVAVVECPDWADVASWQETLTWAF